MPNCTLAPTWSYHFGHRKFSATATARPDRWRAFQAFVFVCPPPVSGRAGGRAQIHTETSPARLELRVRSDVSIENNTCRFLSVTWIQAAWELGAKGTGPRGPSGRHARSTGRFLRAVQWTHASTSTLSLLFEDGGGVWYKPPARHAAPSVRLLLSRLLPVESLPSLLADRVSPDSREAEAIAAPLRAGDSLPLALLFDLKFSAESYCLLSPD